MLKNLRHRYPKFRYWTSRWRTADFFNRFRFTCWCDLVDWALFADPERRHDTPREERPLLFCWLPWYRPHADRWAVVRPGTAATANCVENAGREGACYCGKFRTQAVEDLGVFNDDPGFVIVSELPKKDVA